MRACGGLDTLGAMRGERKLRQVEKELSFLPGRQLVRAVVLLLVVGLVVVALFLTVPGLYRQVKLSRLVADAEREFEAGRVGQAVLAAQTALLLDPRHVRAMDLLADAAEAGGSPVVLELRRRLMELDAGGAGRRLDLARAELASGLAGDSLETLGGIPEGERTTAAYWNLRSAAELAVGDRERARVSAERALELAGDDAGASLRNLAVVLLHEPTRESSERLNELVREAWEDPGGRMEITRLLIDVARANGEMEAALSLAEQNAAREGAGVGEDVEVLDVMAGMDRDRAVERGAAILRSGGRSPDEQLPLVRWLLRHGRGDVVLEWLGGLPEGAADSEGLRLVHAEALAVAGEWERLRGLIEGQDWAGAEFIRLAYMARALEESGQGIPAGARWRQALREASASPQFLWSLVSVSEAWPGWEERRREAMWQLYEKSRNREILRLLGSEYAREGDAENLLRVARLAYEAEPGSFAAANNFAYLSLLLDRQVERAAGIARDLHGKYPEEPAAWSTWLWAMHREGRGEEALERLADAPESVRVAEPLALAVALLHAGAGDPAAAREALARVDSERLLDAERRIHDEILDSLSP